MGALNQNEVELRALEREAAANRQLLESFLTHYEAAAAKAEADARAAARARAEAAPAVKVSVRELPSPTAPARDLKAVAPLVESATDRNGQLGTVPPAFRKAPMPAAKSLLDTGSLVSLPGRLPLPRKPLGTPSAMPQNHQRPKPQDQERKAG